MLRLLDEMRKVVHVVGVKVRMAMKGLVLGIDVGHGEKSNGRYFRSP
jgi:hypothetical protein